MGLFDGFNFNAGSTPGIYADWMQPGALDAITGGAQPQSGLLGSGAPAAAAPAAGPAAGGGGLSGFLQGLNKTDPTTGMSKMDQVGRFGALMKDFGQNGNPNLTSYDQAMQAPQAMQNNMLSQALARQKQSMLQGAFSQIGAAPQQPGAQAAGQPQYGAPPTQGGYPQAQPQGAPQGMGGYPQPQQTQQQPMSAPGGAPSGATFPGPQPMGLPVIPGAHASQVTPALRRALATMALVDGHPDQALTMMDDRKKITAGPGGVLFDQDTGEVVGRIPSYKYTSSGQRYDDGDPNAPKFLGEAPTKGAEPVYNAQGQAVGWHMADGSIQALKQAYDATGGAETALHNRNEEAVGRANAGSGAVSAGASAQNAATSTANSGNVAPPPGFVIRRPR